MVPCVPTNASRTQPTLCWLSPVTGDRHQVSTLWRAEVLCPVYPRCLPGSARRSSFRINSQRTRVLACNSDSELPDLICKLQVHEARNHSGNPAGVEEQLYLTCIGLVAVVLLWCPSTEAFEVADAQAAVQSTKVQLERTLVKALNWPYSQIQQQSGTSSGDSGSPRQDGWRLPRPDHLLQSFATKDVVSC
jgi:hypothetical protein